MSSSVKKCPSSLLPEPIDASGISSAGTVLGSSIMCDSRRAGHGHPSQVGKCNVPLTPTGMCVGSRTTCDRTPHGSAAGTRLIFPVRTDRPLASRSPVAHTPSCLGADAACWGWDTVLKLMSQNENTILGQRMPLIVAFRGQFPSWGQVRSLLSKQKCHQVFVGNGNLPHQAEAGRRALRRSSFVLGHQFEKTGGSVPVCLGGTESLPTCVFSWLNEHTEHPLPQAPL